MIDLSPKRLRKAPPSSVVDLDSLDHVSLVSLLEMDVIAIRIRRFYDRKYCNALAGLLYDDVVKSESESQPIYNSNIESFWSARASEHRLERYLASAGPLEQQLRSWSAPHPSPVDRILRALADAWPSGVSHMSTQGRAMPFGFTRLWSQGSEALPHQDVLWREIPDDQSARGQRGQLAVNLYLDTSSEGGELEVWDYVVDDEQYRSFGDAYAGSYGFPRAALPTTSVLITPEVGDLVFINSLCVHAVRKVGQGRRITLSGFIGNWGNDRPLRCWS